MRDDTPLSSHSPRRSVFSKTTTTILLLTLCLFIVFGLAQTAKAPAPEKNLATGRLVGKTFTLEIADSQQAIRTGLSGRAKLADYHGMLFVFPVPEKVCFWMKGMNFNLDIFWFGTDKKLIYQQQNLPAATYPRSFCPPGNASYVVETNPGLVDLKLGDELLLQKQ